MAEEPKDATALKATLETAFAWLTTQWEESGEKTWADLNEGFVVQLGFTDAAKHPVIVDFKKHVDELRIDGERDEQHDLLVDKDARDKVLGPLIDDWETTHRWIDERWVVWHADKNEWLTRDGEPLEDDQAEDATEDAAATEESADATEDIKRDDPEAVAGDLVLKIIAPAIGQAVDKSPELAGLDPEERHSLAVRVTTEQLAKL